MPCRPPPPQAFSWQAKRDVKRQLFRDPPVAAMAHPQIRERRSMRSPKPCASDANTSAARRRPGSDLVVRSGWRIRADPAGAARALGGAVPEQAVRTLKDLEERHGWRRETVWARCD